MTKINTLNIFIQDIKKALKNDCYFGALALALTLPDICGKIIYPELDGSKKGDVRKRYVRCFDFFIGQYERNITENKDVILPYLDGELCYELRCALFHQGENSLEKRKIKNFTLNKFTLIIEKHNEFEIYCDSSSSNGSLSINIRNLCNKIVWTFEHALRTAFFEESKLPYLNIVEY